MKKLLLLASAFLLSLGYSKADTLNVEGQTALITSVDQLSSNASDEEEGKDIGALIDGDYTTFWHTDWHGKCEDDYHYLQVDLAEAYTGNLAAEIQYRSGASNDFPTTMKVWASADGETFTEVTDINFIYTGAGEWAHSASFPVENAKSLRFATTNVAGGEAFRKFWHLAEFQLYSVPGTVEEEVAGPILIDLEGAANSIEWSAVEGEEHSFHIVTVGGDPYMSMTGINRPIAKDEYYVYFEYRTPKSINCEFFPSPIAGGREVTFTLPATPDYDTSDEYSKIYVSVRDYTPMNGNTWGNAAGDYLRIDVGTGEGEDLYIRNIRMATEAEYEASFEPEPYTLLTQDADGFYLISTPEDLASAAGMVNQGGYNDASFKLTADIDMSMTYCAPIGWSKISYSKGQDYDGKGFNGVFDGQGHTISNMTYDESKDARICTGGVFGTVTGTVKNLLVARYSTGDLVADGRFGGLVGVVLTGGLIENCGVIDSYVHRDGGICAALAGTNYGGTIRYCFEFNNDVLAYKRSGRLIGDPADDNKVRIGTEENCFSQGYVAGDPTQGGYASEKIDNGENFTEEQFASGEVAFKMNYRQSAPAWFQTIGDDMYPVLDSTHKQVYADGEFQCDGSPLPGSTLTYTNTETSSQIPDHEYVDGICQNCGAFQPGFMKKDEEGYYLLQYPAQLITFGEYVNGGQATINARLVADIDMSEVENFTPIGLYSDDSGTTPNNMNYKGIFDGQGHIIYNLRVYVDTKHETGLFSRCESATIKNLGIVNANIENTQAIRAGVLGGEIYKSQIINCFTAGELQVTTDNDKDNRGGFFGEGASTTLTNSFTTFETMGSGTSASSGGTTVVNSYWGEDVKEMGPTGELCFKLNNGTFLDPVWYQTIGEDELPTFDNTHGLVYQKADGSYASLTDDSFEEFRDEVVYAQREYIDEVVCQVALTETFEGFVNDMAEASDYDTFMGMYRDLDDQKTLVEENAQAYIDYEANIATIKAYLEANDFSGEARDMVEKYVGEDAVEPNEEEFPNGSYAYVMNALALGTDEVIAESDFAKNLLDLAVKSDYQPGSDVTSLIVNADFSNGTEGWTIEGTAVTIYNTPFEGGKTFAAGDCYRLSQTLENMKDGYYFLKANAGCRDCLSYDHNISYNYCGFFGMNDYQTYVANLADGMFSAVEGETPEDLAEGYRWEMYDENGDLAGYAIYGVDGHGYFFSNGKYENYMVAKVTDGVMEVVFNNTPGCPAGNNSLNLGNISLTYLGDIDNECATTPLDLTLNQMLERADNVLNKYAFDDEMNYAKAPNFSISLKDQLAAAIQAGQAAGSNEEKFAAIETLSNLFKAIYECKSAYIALLDKALEIESEYATVEEGTEPTEDAVKAMDLNTKAWSGYLNDIDLSAEEALAMVEEMNSYLGLYMKPDPSLTNHECTYSNVAPWTYQISLPGSDPYIGLTALTEDLDKSKTYYLCFEYKSESTRNSILFPSPATGGHEIKFEIAQASEWTLIFVPLADALNKWSWGKKGSFLRIDPSPDMDADLYMRYIQIVDEAKKAQFEANAIESIADEAPATFKGAFDLQGRSIQKLQKNNIYILDGKKTLVK